jgi:dTMP kinase
LLVERLAELEIPYLLVREPGGTELGEYLRAYLKSARPLTREAELLLFEAARVELVTSHILPALEDGQVVVADRFYGSTVAYQGYGRGLDLNVINSLNNFAALEMEPDLVFMLDLEPEVGIQRAMSFQTTFAEDSAGGLVALERSREGTRFEDLDLAFHYKARDGFLAQAEAQPGRWTLLNGLKPVDEIREEVWGRVRERRFPTTVAKPRAARNSAPQGELWPQVT